MKKKPTSVEDAKIKLAIVGGRNIDDYDILRDYGIRALRFAGIFLDNVKEIVSGGARGADALSVDLSIETKIPHKAFIAEWEKPDGSKDVMAGKKRNTLIVDECDAAIALWDGYSTGTGDTLSKLASRDKPYIVVFVQFSDPPPELVRQRKHDKKKPVIKVREIYVNNVQGWNALSDRIIQASVDASLKRIKEEQNEKKRKTADKRRGSDNKKSRK